MGLKVARERGAIGQFDVFVDDKLVASRGGSMLKKALGGGWPDPDEVVALIEKLQGK